MCVESSAPYLITTGFWDVSFFESCEHRSRSHHRPSQPSTFIPEFFTFEKIQVNIIGLEFAGVAINAICFNTHSLQKVDKKIHIDNIGNVADGYLPGSEQDRADDLKRLIFCALGYDFTL